MISTEQEEIILENLERVGENHRRAELDAEHTAAERRSAVRRALDDGLTVGQVADAVGISEERIVEIAAA